MKCNFSGITWKEDPFIHQENHELRQKKHFKYLGSMINANEDIDEDITNQIAVKWLKWRVA